MDDQVLIRLQNWVTNSGLGEGDRLPPERTLCTELGVSRADLRKAYLVLEADGQLTRSVGRGTFLAKPKRPQRGDGMKRTIMSLAETTSPLEAMNARMVVEPQIAQLAAMHATPKQLQELARLSDQMRDATSWSRYEELDRDFHEMIAEAAGNSLLGAVHKIINRVRLVVVWRKLDTTDQRPPATYHSFAEHDAILAALQARNGEQAYAAMQAHLDSTLAMMTAPRTGGFQ
ncbi:DNA-binding transcriptional regulator, FadR family [Monaibacterium marinum]|uniref:DNA-binding transcriptional regulator, FadR family n=1 Tax=Pontivivens marinum TaxID=1690039 RepID=A0A2C9CUN2_9RHOB|nr:FadR/GntR family transcriptional regulator [Monaibacterium marinum]SOH94923.1 DNA-binding transcriptional regulator, FadR family [Monaibacterium marinum]